MLLAQVTPADVIGEALRLHLGPTAWPAVATRTFSLGEHEVTLEVLAASHRVQVRLAGSAVATLTETVACGTDGTTPVEASTLPSVHEVDLDGGRYRFESTTLHGSGPVESAARSVREVAQGLTVAFPGHPDALTGIRLDHRGIHARADATAISWTTWHVYPGALPHVVTTSSTYTPLRRST